MMPMRRSSECRWVRCVPDREYRELRRLLNESAPLRQQKDLDCAQSNLRQLLLTVHIYFPFVFSCFSGHDSDIESLVCRSLLCKVACARSAPFGSRTKGSTGNTGNRNLQLNKLLDTNTLSQKTIGENCVVVIQITLNMGLCGEQPWTHLH